MNALALPAFTGTRTDPIWTSVLSSRPVLRFARHLAVSHQRGGHRRPSRSSIPRRLRFLPSRAQPLGGMPCSARSTFSEVAGRSVIHTPMASWMALMIAGACELAVISPMPLAPYGPVFDPISTITASSSGTSLAVGIM